MLDFKIDIGQNTKQLNNNLKIDFNKKNDSFSKVFEYANKSFEATKKSISNDNKKENNFLEKIKEKVSKINSDKEQLSKKSTKTEDVDTEEMEEGAEAISNATVEQILLNYKSSSINNQTDDVELNAQNTQQLRDASEKLLHQKEKTLEMTAKLLSELKESQTKLATQNPIKTSDEKISVPQFFEKNNNDVALNSDALLNLQNLAETKTGDNTNLSDVLAELDVEVTSVKTENAGKNEARNFDFNSSSFNNLSGHVTKLSLNKTADFSKVFGQKLSQEQQILNQVKEGTLNQLNKESTSVNIILRPESLGKVNINIVSNNGTLSAQITAQSQQAADALSKNIDTLKQNLIDQGLKVSEVNVKVQESSSADAFADSKNFEDDKLSNFKENNSNKNSYKAEHSNNNGTSQTYFENEEAEEQEEISAAVSHKNNDLGIYNNMGRKV